MGRAIVMSKKYLIKLTPQGKFFFGGDMTFGTGRKDEDEKYVSYIIHSAKMPQQTSLLGMLRFLLLSNNPNLFDKAENHIIKGKEEEVTSWIGKHSFSVEENPSRKEYGKIQHIGPCFLLRKEDRKLFFKAPMDTGLCVDFNKCVKACANGKEMEVPEIEVEEKKEKRKEKPDLDPRFSGKDDLGSLYLSVDGSEKKRESELFIQDSRIGIDKDYEGKAASAAFYKQLSYRLDKDFCFAFEVEMADDIALADYSKTLVKVGADDSSFLLEVDELRQEVEYPQWGDAGKLVLLSDTYLPLPDDQESSFRYAITRIRPFRFLSSGNSVDARDYNVKYKTFRSDRYDLYEAGSVFYFKDEKLKAKYCELINNYPDFVQVGYNKYC